MIKNIPEGELERIHTKNIHPNPENPRLIFDDPEMNDLKESIRKVGILVPLIVYRDDGKVFLLDGERRWRCALELELPDVPANVIAKPTQLQNLLRMFNIHNVRKEWSIIETAWKLKKIIMLTKETNERKLVELTGLKIHEIRRLKVLLSFPDSYQKLVFKYIQESGQEKKEKRGGIKPDFFIEMFPVINKLKSDYSKLFDEYGYSFIDIFIDKYRQEKIKNVTEFRMFRKMLNSENKGVSKKKIETAIREFIKIEDMGIKEMYDNTAKSCYDFAKLSNTTEDLLLQLGKIKVEDIPEDNRKNIQKTLRVLRDSIEQLLGKL